MSSRDVPETADFGTDQRDVTSAEREQDVALAKHARDLGAELVAGWHVADDGAGRDGGVGHDPSGDAGDGRLAGAVHIGHDGEVGCRKGSPHGHAVRRGARIEVGLKCGDDAPPRKCLTGGGERGHQLGRMMRIVVHERDTVHVAEAIEATTDAGELAEGARRALEVRVQRERHAERRTRIAEIVRPRHAQRQLHLASIRESHIGYGPVGPHLPGDELHGPAFSAEAPHALAQARGKPIAAGIGSADQDARCSTREGGVGRFHRLDIAVALEVIGLDIVDHGDGGLQGEERLVVFIGLDHEEVVAVEQRVATPGGNAATGESRRMEPSAAKRLGGHDGRSGLAVRTRDGHQRGTVHELGQRDLAGHDGDPGDQCRTNLGMVLRRRRRDHQGPCPDHVCRIRTVVRHSTGRHEVGKGRCLGVAPGHGHAAPQGGKRQRTHSRAAEAEEVDGSWIGGVEQGGHPRKIRAGGRAANAEWPQPGFPRPRTTTFWHAASHLRSGFPHVIEPMPTSRTPTKHTFTLLLLAATLPIHPLSGQTPREVKPIVVVGARSATTIGGASAVVVTADSLLVPAAAPLERLLRAVPFLLVRQNSRGESELSVRGSDSRQAAVMLDGMPLTLGWDHRSDPSLVPMTGISMVTVVRGLSSLLGGPNVLGGTVSFGLASRERRPTARFGTSMDGVGALGMSGSGSIPIETRLGFLTVRGGLGFRDRRGVALAREGAAGDGLTGGIPDPGQDGEGRLRTNSDLSQRDGFAAMRLDGGNGRFASMTATGYQGSRGVPGELHVDEPRRWRHPDVRRGVAIMSAGTGEVTTPLGRGRLEGSIGTNRGDLAIESFADAAFETVVSREVGAERTNTARLFGSHSLGGRAELTAAFTRATVEYDETLGFDRTSNYRQQLHSIGAELNLPLSMRTQLSAGIVRDDAETPRSGGKPALPRLGKTGWRLGFSQLAIGDAVRVHGSISERSRFPALRELYSGALDRFVPNPSLRPETLLGMEVGATLIGGVANAGAILQAVLYHHQLRDAVVRVARPDRQFERVNRDEMRSTGLELLVGWTALPGSRGGLPVGTRISADLTVQRIRLYDRLLPAGVPDARRAEHNPEIRASLDLSLPFASQWRGNAAVHVTGAQYCVHPDLGRQIRLGAQQISDLGVTRDVAGRGIFRAMRAVMAVDNVTDAAAYDQCGLPQAGRTVRVGVELR